jgi:autoinducer 2-degrading protein
MPGSLLAVHVQVQVAPDSVDAFRDATLANASASLQEPGVVRFDVLQDLEAPARFVLVEVYRDANAAAAHKETAHYRAWRDAVAPMMAEPRSSRRFANAFPPDDRW